MERRTPRAVATAPGLTWSLTSWAILPARVVFRPVPEPRQSGRVADHPAPHARHTCGALIHLRGVPTAVISKWLGHATAGFTMAPYVHSQDDALAAAGAVYATAIRASQSGV
jgi:integrase